MMEDVSLFYLTIYISHNHITTRNPFSYSAIHNASQQTNNPFFRFGFGSFVLFFFWFWLKCDTLEIILVFVKHKAQSIFYTSTFEKWRDWKHSILSDWRKVDFVFPSFICQLWTIRQRQQTMSETPILLLDTLLMISCYVILLLFIEAFFKKKIKKGIIQRLLFSFVQPTIYLSAFRWNTKCEYGIFVCFLFVALSLFVCVLFLYTFHVKWK